MESQTSDELDLSSENNEGQEQPNDPPEGKEAPVEDAGAAPIVEGEDDLEVPQLDEQPDAEELARKVAELEEQLRKQTSGEQNKEDTLPEKPQLADHDFDAEKYEKALGEWYEKKAAFDKKQNDINSSRDKERQVLLDKYTSSKKAVKRADFEEKEKLVGDTLSVTKQAILIRNSKNSAFLVYTLGCNPNTLRRLASVPDEDFGYELAKLEENLMKSKPSADTPVKQGKTGGVTSSDRNLDKLRAQADKTGDYTAVIAARREAARKSK